MNKKIILIISTIVSFLAIGAIVSVLCLSFKEEDVELKQKSNIFKSEIDKRKKVDNKNVDHIQEDDILTLLPEDALLCKIYKNGFNENKTLFSVNIYYPNDRDEKLQDGRKISDIDFSPYIGSWILDVKNSSAKRIASSPDDYNFHKWVDVNSVELLDDGKYSATTYNALTGNVVSKRIFNLNTNADISNWNTYKSEEYGFKIKYPKNFFVEEMKENFAENIENRYVSFSSHNNDVQIFLGVKNILEENISPRPFRTGVGSTEILSRGTVAFGDGFANERWILDCAGVRCVVHEIWFCNENNNVDWKCDNIQINEQDEVYMGVIIDSEARMDEIQELLGGIIRTFQIL
ncbi:MAG: hypothetical protein CR972_04515 [Candidatus Moraniibacteriota bacterium]|nr:MAG: hypothetical protein CR972_04515 [Candidatus Moranbacteria bacterium]